MTDRDVLRLARGVASHFEGVAVEGVVEFDATAAELRLSVPAPQGGQRCNVVVRVRCDEGWFGGDLRGQIRAALLHVWSRRPQSRAQDAAARVGHPVVDVAANRASGAAPR